VVELLDTDTEQWTRHAVADRDPVVPPPSPTSPFTILLHRFSDAAPGAFLDFASLRGRDAYSFAWKA